jgi:hypothetical protein
MFLVFWDAGDILKANLQQLYIITFSSFNSFSWRHRIPDERPNRSGPPRFRQQLKELSGPGQHLPDDAATDFVRMSDAVASRSPDSAARRLVRTVAVLSDHRAEDESVAGKSLKKVKFSSVQWLESGWKICNDYWS